jgi:hypothetical protein
MNRHLDDEWDEDEAGSQDLGEQGDDTIPCPYCRRAIHEDSQRCPYCENYLSAEDAPPGPKPWWFVIGVLVCLVIVFLWILMQW